VDGSSGGFVGTNCDFAVEESLERCIGAVESSSGGRMMAVEVFEGGGFVGT
jgi:hypothetical protein